MRLAGPMAIGAALVVAGLLGPGPGSLELGAVAVGAVPAGPDGPRAAARAVLLSGGQQPGAAAALSGRVRLADGPVPAPERFENTLDPEGCGRWRTRQDVRVHPDDRGIADVVVAVVDAPSVPRTGPDPERLVLDHRDCRFEPRVAVLGVGGVIETVNRDHVIHTAHLHGALQGNLALPLHGQSVQVIADRPGMITVLCDLHRWMRAFVRVDAHPFHAVTDAHGRFRIPDLPPGEHELEFWHERLGRRLRTVILEAGTEVGLDLVLELPDAPVEGS